MLKVQNVHTYYGNVHALRGVTLDVERGEIVSLIGANGAGKSTLLMTICGNPHASRGAVVFDGADITKLPTHEIVRLGISHSPEGRRIFSYMTVLENLQIGAGDFFEEELERVFTLFPRLKERLKQRGGTMSGGEQQMLSIARALMSRPKLLLLDEPSLGLAPILVRQIFEAIENINRKDRISILLVEQNAYHALHLADRAYVMVNGVITLTGSGEELLEKPEIRRAYLEGG
ncbi:high-affinity branched-chain amino acid ABC transporter ATP-binding protein [Candidatus Magnetoovum chiemensis]|nr:high-affinity branched-chain amino acid ABC transporter ATP-binding protein [Candidatus Magnetoovum chiemensis]